MSSKKVCVERALLDKLFEGFSIIRWNDRMRPHDLSQLDKEAHKMFLVYLFGRLEEREVDLDWDKLISAGVFQLLKKTALSDIKVAVMRRVTEDQELNNRINVWVAEKFRPFFSPELNESFRRYLEEEDRVDCPEYKILRAAHKYSTLREFEVLGVYSEKNSFYEATEAEIYRDLLPFMDLAGLQQMLAKQDLYKFNLIFEQLRYQVRWSQTPRIPKTTVMGHSIFVALLMFFFTKQISDSPHELFANFYAGLFHDLPESVTRDIVSPTKHAVEGLDDIIGRIEEEIVEQELFKYLGSSGCSDLKRELTAFTQDEFSDRILQVKNQLVPIHGKMLKMADELAAMMEASKSITHGITSNQLRGAMTHIYEKREELTNLGAVDASCVKVLFEELYEICF